MRAVLNRRAAVAGCGRRTPRARWRIPAASRWLALLIGLLGACSDSRGRVAATADVQGRVVGNPAVRDVFAPDLRLHGGQWWPTRTLGVSVSKEGTFAVPDTLHALVLFRDTDHDGTLDRFAEPSSVCSSKRGEWWCETPSSRLYLHRIARRMDGEVVDKTHVIFDAYDPAGAPDTGARVCVAGGQCSAREVGPFYGASAVPLLSLCEAGDEDLRIDATSHAGTSTVLAPPPRAVRVEVTRDRGTTDGDLIRVRASEKIAWAVSWVGTLSNGATSSVLWTTEGDGDAVSIGDDGAVMRVPARQLEGCPDCSVVVQVAFDVADPARPGTLPSYFEYQEVFSP
jgi:hypothetical protein